MTPAQTGPAPIGSFRTDGSWDSRATVRGSADAFVRELVRQRQRTRATPAEFYAFVRASQFPELLGSCGDASGTVSWSRIDAWEDWPLVCTSTSASELIKRCGRPLSGHDWAGGTWLPADRIEYRERAEDLAAVLSREAAQGNALAADWLWQLQGGALQGAPESRGSSTDAEPESSAPAAAADEAPELFTQEA